MVTVLDSIGQVSSTVESHGLLGWSLVLPICELYNSLIGQDVTSLTPIMRDVGFSTTCCVRDVWRAYGKH
jgi:hypothetical protein